MREIYVSVHEEALRMLLDREPNHPGNGDIESVLAEIDRIRGEKQVFEIPGDIYPDLLPRHMPLPHPDLRVKVVGTSQWVCCSLQLYSLRGGGYRAELHPEGCYDNGHFSHLLQIDRRARRLVPEFFEALLQDSPSF